MLLADPPPGSGWEPIEELTDEFDGEELDAGKWHDHNPDWKGRQPGFFSRENVSVKDGMLHLTARVEELENVPEGYHTFTTAAVKSKALVKYGYFEIRCRPMKSKASSAFWFYRHTKEEWTEIDVFELAGAGKWMDKYDRRNRYNMNVHVFHSPTVTEHFSNKEVWVAPFHFTDDFHVFALEWDKDTIKWYVNGEVVRTLENTHWHQPLHMNFDSETMPDWFGLPDPANLPSTFSIDYIRSWRKTE